MQLRHLWYFVATADAGTVSGAAAAVHVTQPALSRQLRQLEADLGVGLFDRAAGRLSLSRAGRELLPQARAVLAAADGLQARAGFLSVGRLERLTIAAPTVTLTDVVAPFVATVPPEDPVVDVRAADGLSPGEMLDAGADLAVGARAVRAPYASAPLAELPVWAFVPPGDPWAARARVELEELMARPLICLPPAFTSRQALDVAVERDGLARGPLLEVANGTIAQAMAAAGRGVAVVSDDPRFDLVPLAVGVGESTLGVRLRAAWDSRSAAADDLEALAGRLSAFVAERYPVSGSGR